jgi:antitoxin PrlF
MATTVTIKGQVTLPKGVRDATGIKPGEKTEALDDYVARLRALAERRLIDDGMTTDEFMRWTRGDPDEDPPAPQS